MKIRTCFVANSSSASFIVMKNNLSQQQIQMIHDHESCGREYADTDPWIVRDTGDVLLLSTSMDNFDMESYLLEEVGLSEEQFEDGPEGLFYMDSLMGSISEKMDTPIEDWLEDLRKKLKSLDEIVLSDDKAKKLEEEKKKAVEAQDFNRADELREELEDMEIEVQDEIIEEIIDNLVYYDMALRQAIGVIKNDS